MNAILKYTSAFCSDGYKFYWSFHDDVGWTGDKFDDFIEYY